MFVVVILPRKNGFVVRHRLQERFLWSVITYKDDFCERQPCPARTTNSRTANFGFTNYSCNSFECLVSFVCSNVRYQERREEVLECIQEGDGVEFKSIELAPFVHSCAKHLPP